MGGCQVALWLLMAVLRCDGQLLTSNSISKARRLPGIDICGQYKVFIDESIIGGTPAELGQFPWMANIGYTTQGDSTLRWLCGGSLISDQYILTAAHCVHPSTTVQARRNPVYASKIRLGELDLNPDKDDQANPLDLDIEKITYHQSYNNFRKENDIALIKLKNKVTFTSLIGPICLPPPQFQDQSLVGKKPVIAGWGKNITDAPSTEQTTHLLWAEVEIKDTQDCGRNITKTKQLKNAVIDHRVVCASAKDVDSCQGDSGGPLMLVENIRGSKKNYFLIGIVAYGYGCAVEGYPGVYTRVIEYMSWILDNMDI